MNFKKFERENVKDNIFDYYDNTWFLISAGTSDDFNMMTAGWGGMGIMWAQPVFYVVVRKSRYTLEFMEKYDTFTCSYYDNKYKEALTICGSQSGRDIDKAKEAGLSVVQIPNRDAVTFAEANQTFVCKKILSKELDEQCYIDKEIYKECYSDDDTHILFIGIIEEYSA